MNLNLFQRHSLKTRVTLYTLAIFLVGIWSLAFYASHSLRDDMEKMLSDQQFSTVSFMAAALDEELSVRFWGLKTVAGRITPELLADTTRLQDVLEHYEIFQRQFNGGTFITGVDGTATVSVPRSAERQGTNYLDRDYMVTAIKEGGSSIGQPVIGKKLNAPIFVMAAPIRNAQGTVIGVLAGVTNLGAPNFLDKVTGKLYGKTGGYLIVSPRDRLIVTASDRNRIMAALPAPAPAVKGSTGRFIAGYEGSDVVVNSLGKKVLASAKSIPVAGWYIAASLPVEEAFAPIQHMQQRLLMAAGLLTLLIGGLCWWVLTRQLAPMLAASKVLRGLSDGAPLPHLLPIQQQDEVGTLVAGINRLLAIVAQRENAIIEAGRRFRLMADSAPVMIWYAGDDSRYEFFNKVWLDFTGRSVEQEVGIGWADGVHPEDFQRCLDTYATAFKARQCFTMEYRLRRFDGEYRWLIDHGVPRFDELGIFVGYIGSCIDITERKLAEQLHKESELRLQMALSGADMATWDWHIQSGTLICSSRWAQIQGCTPDELRPRIETWEKRVFPDDLPALRALLDRHFKGETPVYAAEYRIRHKDGHWVWVHSLGKVVAWDGIGNPLRAMGIALDISTRKNIESALVESEERHRNLSENSSDWVWAMDLNGHTTYTNEKGAELLGLSLKEFLATDSITLVHPDDLPLFRQVFEQAVAGRTGWRNIRIRFQHKDGSYRTLESSASPLFDLAGNLTGFQGMDRDISAREALEAELISAKAAAEKANNDKLRFLAAASHDLRQPLTALSLYIGVLAGRVTPENVKLIGSIQNCLKSLSELLTDLLDVSKLEAGVVIPKLSGFAIDELLAPLLSVHAAEAELKGLRLHFRRCSAVVRTDQMLLARLVGNLIVNAIRYTNQGGILIACRRHQGKLWLEVWDTGVGIAEEHLGSIFEEFKQLGDEARTRGSGLGLAIVDKTAKLLNLKIRVCSRPGRGSMFAIELPLGRVLEPATATPPQDAARRLRIGLVDDNTNVLQALTLVLEDVGHEVVAATNGSELIARLAQQAPDIVISDYRLAEMETGFDVIAAARALFGQQLPAFIITGDTDPALIRNMTERGITVHYKPLQIEALQACIIDATEQQLA